MNGYTDLIFDLYGTLIDIHTEENDLVWEKTALFFGFHGAHYTSAELKEAFQTQIREKQIRAGQSYECFPDIPFDGILADLFAAKGIWENREVLGFQAAQLFRICSTEYIRLYPGVLDSLAALRRRGYRLWLLTNAQEVFTKYELVHLGLWDAFDGIYISSTFGFRKPDRRFFQALLDGEHLDPAKCLMIGNDTDTDIAGAKSAGLSTLYMHTNLTPPDQREADSESFPRRNLRHMEFEGSDWNTLTKLICSL